MFQGPKGFFNHLGFETSSSLHLFPRWRHLLRWCCDSGCLPRWFNLLGSFIVAVDFSWGGAYSLNAMLCGRIIAGIDKGLAILRYKWLTWRNLQVLQLVSWVCGPWRKFVLRPDYLGVGWMWKAILKLQNNLSFQCTSYSSPSTRPMFHSTRVKLHLRTVFCCECLSSKDVSCFDMDAERHFFTALTISCLLFVAANRGLSFSATLSGAEGGNCVLVPALLPEKSLATPCTSLCVMWQFLPSWKLPKACNHYGNHGCVLGKLLAPTTGTWLARVLATGNAQDEQNLWSGLAGCIPELFQALLHLAATDPWRKLLVIYIPTLFAWLHHTLLQGLFATGALFMPWA